MPETTKQTKLDVLLSAKRERDAARRAARQSCGSAVALGLLAVVAGESLGWPGPMRPATAIAFAGATMVAAALGVVSFAKSRSFDHLIDVVSWSARPDLLHHAVATYGYEDGVIAAIECGEGHLAGDCPLCGAA